MQIYPYPIALRTQLSDLHMAREVGRITGADHDQQADALIDAARDALTAKGYPIDATWTSTGADGATPEAFIDNPNGLTMVWWKL